jgi:predicted nucleotidyltransferase component of viral defense system
MVASASATTGSDAKRTVHQVLQQVALAGMYRAGMFEKAVFYGGTCLRVFHGLDRFSEDLDFSLREEDQDFDLSCYKAAIEGEFKSFGCEVTLERRQKPYGSPVESAFLKSDTSLYDLKANLRGNIKIKIEVDKRPPLKFRTEAQLCVEPFSFYVPCFVLPDLFAGKMHAALFRKWKNRVKGRDWYDFEWYVRNHTPLDLRHFSERAMQSEAEITEPLTRERFFAIVFEKIETLDIESVKDDVRPFIANPRTLDIWSKEYFMALAKKIEFSSED